MAYIGEMTPAEALNRVMDDRVASTRITGARTLANLAAAGRVKTATKQNIDWDVELGGESAGVGETHTATTLQTGSKVVPANLKVGKYRVFHRFDISRLDIQEAANAAPRDLQDLFGNTVDRGLNAIARKLNGFLYTGDGLAASGGIFGMNYILDGTKPYAGIDPLVAGQESWKGYVKTVAGTVPTMTQILDFDAEVSERELFYDMVIMSPTKAANYHGQFAAQTSLEYFTNQRDSLGFRNADLGHGGRSFNGLPIIEDPKAASDTIYLASLSDITLHCFELAQGPSEPNTSPIAINRSYGIPIHIAELASTNSAVRTFELYIIPQLQVFNRRTMMAIKTT